MMHEIPSAPPVLSIIVVSYNTRDMTLCALRTVHAETRTPFEIILVDNASQDGSAAAVAREFPQVLLLAEAQNHGFAKANNLAAARARGEYLLLLNPDTEVLDGAIDRLLDFARQRPAARIWGGRTLFADRSLNPASCWRRMTLWGLICQATGLRSLLRNSALFNPESYGGWDRGSERAVDIVSGCFFLIARADWQALDGFHPDFFMYGEEADLCLRAQRQLGARPRITPAATIVHHAGASETVRADKMVRLLRAKRALIRRHFPVWQQPFALALFAAWPLSRWRATGMLARLTGKTGLRERSRIWGEIWTRRPEWRVELG
jgi:GT2 family glycosyltransferase